MTFILDDYSRLNIKLLFKLCKLKKIKKYSHLKKKDLINYYNSNLAASKIINYFRKYLYSNILDPITMDYVEYPCFLWNPPNTQKLLFYNYSSLVEYIIKTGDTKDPSTRIPFSDNDLTRLDRQSKKKGYKYRSTLKIKNNERYLLKVRNIQNEIRNIEMRINELRNLLKIALEGKLYLFINEPIVVDSVEYPSPINYVISLIRELSLLIRNMRLLDSNNGDYYRNQINNEITLWSDNYQNIIINHLF